MEAIPHNVPEPVTVMEAIPQDVPEPVSHRPVRQAVSKAGTDNVVDRMTEAEYDVEQEEILEGPATTTSVSQSVRNLRQASGERPPLPCPAPTLPTQEQLVCKS